MAATPSADIPQFEIGSTQGPDGICVVKVVGEVDMSHQDEVRGELRRAAESDSRGIVIDLTECEFIDSSGVRALLLSREAKGSGEEAHGLAVAASSDQTLRILSV